MTKRLDWVHKIENIIDAKASQEFTDLLTSDGIFRFGNQPEVVGRPAISAYVEAFFNMIKSSRHEVVAVHECEDCITWEGKVTYTRLDGNQVQVPFCNILRMEAELIKEYLIYIDNTPLFAPWDENKA